MSKHTILMLSALAAFIVGWICGGSRAVEAAREQTDAIRATTCREVCGVLPGEIRDGVCKCLFETLPRESAR